MIVAAWVFATAFAGVNIARELAPLAVGPMLKLTDSQRRATAWDYTHGTSPRRGSRSLSS